MSRKNESMLDVLGMSCSSCVHHVGQALREVEGVTEVEVRLREGKVRVRHDPNEAPLERLIAALRDAGYEASLSRSVASAESMG